MQFGIPITIINVGTKAVSTVISYRNNPKNPNDHITPTITMHIEIKVVLKERKKKKKIKKKQTKQTEISLFDELTAKDESSDLVNAYDALQEAIHEESTSITNKEWWGALQTGITLLVNQPHLLGAFSCLELGNLTSSPGSACR